jgi:hypothetical protein
MQKDGEWKKAIQGYSQVSNFNGMAVDQESEDPLEKTWADGEFFDLE